MNASGDIKELVIRIDERVNNILENMVTKDEFTPVANQVKENKKEISLMRITIAKWSGAFVVVYGVIEFFVSRFIEV